MQTLKSLALLTALLAAAGASAQGPKPLEVIVFPGGGVWPIWVAQEKGLFARNGVAINLSFTPNSVSQIRGLVEGKYDLGTTAYDNIVAYQEGQGEAEIPVQPDLFAFMGGYAGGLRLLTQPDLRKYPEFKGRTVGVDAATTGFAFVLYKMLAMNGVPQTEYKVERLGGTPARVQALMEGRIAGAIINSPSEILPESKGYHRIGDATAVLGAYPTSVGVTRRSWAAKNGEQLVAFIRSYAAAIDWAYQTSNRDEVISIYLKNLPKVPKPVAEKSYDVMFAGNEGFQRKAKLDLEGARTVLKLRSEFAKPQKNLDDPMKYIDESYYRKAMQ